MSNNKTKKRVFIIVGIFVVVCLLFLSFISPDLPRFVGIDNLEIIGGSNDSLNLLLTLNMDADIGVDAFLREMDYSLLAGDSAVAFGSWRGDLSVPTGEFQIDLPVIILEENIPYWIDAFSAEDSILLEVESEYTVEVLSFEYSSDFTESQNVLLDGFLEKLILREGLKLQPRIVRLDRPGFSLRNSSVDVELEFSNNYSFPITIVSYDFDFQVSNSSIGSISESSTCTISPGETVQQTTQISINNLSPFISAFNTLRNRELAYNLVGLIVVAIEDVQVELPVSENGGLTFDLF